jgi:Uma2 family endonuclease
MSTLDRLADLAPERVRGLKSVEYLRLAEAGFFEDEPIELIRGIIYNKYEDDLVRPLRRVEYEWLVDKGMFDDERVELLGGVIVEMSPQDPRHADTVARLAELLMRAVSAEKQVRAHSPFAVSEDSLLEPDVVVVPRSGQDGAHPSVAYLLIEVANSSLRKDRALKSDVYARAAVPEYWIVNLVDRQVEVRTKPVGGAYTALAVARPGDTIRVASLRDLAIAVDDFLR